MFKLDEDILRCWMRLTEYERQRLWMERLLHPEKLNWTHGSPPPITETKMIRIEELGKMGFNEEYYQRMCDGQDLAMASLTVLVEVHPLWVHFTHINGLAQKLAGGFIAAGGDINRCPTASAFWYGMGLDVLPDGTVPRRIRGKTNVERKVPALPHVTQVGEQIRTQIIRTHGELHERYLRYKGEYIEKYPDRPLIFNHKAGLRIPQKQLYACLWSEWRQAYGLPAPWPYAFAILHHDGRPLTIFDLYDK